MTADPTTTRGETRIRPHVQGARRSGDPLRVIVIDEELPFPLNSGKRIRSFNLLKRLAERHRITYLSHRNQDPTEARLAEAALQDVRIDTCVVEHRVPPKSGVGFYARLLANVFSPLPYSVWSHTSAALQARLNRFLGEGQYDLVHCEWTPYAEFVRNSSKPSVVVAAHNIESQIWQRYFENESGFLKRAYIHHQWRKFQRFERWAFQRADKTLFVSQPDADLAESEYAARKSAVVDNGVDVEMFTPVLAGRDRFELLIMGSLDWRPNVDGINRFTEAVFPQVQQAVPQVRLTIVGRNPDPQWAAKFAQRQGVEIHANVPDVRPYVSRAGSLVVPLRVGGGSRLKILEAAASGLPVVSTRIGAEGLDFVADRDFLAVGSIEELAAPIIKTIRAPENAMAMAANAREAVVKKYNWDALAEKLDAAWRSVVNDSRERR